MARQRSLVVFPTYACNASCGSCGTFSTPKDTSRIDRDAALALLDQTLDSGVRTLVLSGGEPTLQWDTCLELLEKARGLGLSTRMVTNGRWAGSDDEADETIERLRAAGLDELNLSTGDEHVRFVPVENVARGATAATRRGIRTLVMVELRRDRTVTAEMVRDRLPIDVQDSIKIIESPWAPMTIRRRGVYPTGVAVDQTNLERTTGCDSVLSSYVATAEGKLAACCGLGMRTIPELEIGSVQGPLSEAIRLAEGDFMKVWLATWGPHRILAWAAQYDAAIEWEGRYAHRCQACLAVYRDPRVGSVIRDHHADALPGVILEQLTEDVLDEELGAMTSTPRETAPEVGGIVS